MPFWRKLLQILSLYVCSAILRTAETCDWLISMVLCQPLRTAVSLAMLAFLSMVLRLQLSMWKPLKPRQPLSVQTL